MNPILLKIQGLNSYEQEVEIDFNKLSAGGLFGIFGPTGSGKTTIIDAITMCLYGEISRYNGSNGKQCINTNCKSMLLYLKFMINKKLYSVTRAYKKHKDTIKPVLVRFNKIEDSKEFIVADNTEKVNKEIEKLIGLGYKDFSKSVILPQGKFSDFLLLKDRDRSHMLERIFRLEKYGDILIKKISEKNKKYNLERVTLSNKLLELGDVSKKDIEEKEYELENYNMQLLDMKKILLDLESLNEEYIQVKNIYDEYKKYKQKEIELRDEEEKYLKNSDLLNNSIKADSVNTIYKNYNVSNENFFNIKTKLQEEINNLEKLEQQEIIAKKQFSNIENIKEERYTYLIKKQVDLNRGLLLVEDLNKLNLEIVQLQQKYRFYKKNFDKININLKELKEEKTVKSEELDMMDKIKQELHLAPNIKKVALEANECYKKKIELEDNISKKLINLNNIKKNIQNYKQERELNYKNYLECEKELQQSEIELKILINDIPIDRESLFKLKENYIKKENTFNIKKENNVLMNNYKENLTMLINKINDLNSKLNEIKENKLNKEKELEDLDLEIEETKNKNLAAKIAKTLQDNCECPVCGSLEHPKAATISKVINLRLLENKRQLFYDNILQLNEQIQNLSNELILNEREKININNKVIELENIIGDFNLKNESIKLIEEAKYFEKCNEKLILWEKNKIKLEQSIGEQVKYINKFKVKEAAFKERNDNDINFMQQLEIEIKTLEEQKKLLDVKLTQFRDIIATNDYTEFYNKINQNEVKLLKLSEDEKILRNLIKQIDEQLMNEINKFNKLKNKIEKVKTIGQEKRNLMEKLESDIKKISRNKDVHTYLTEVLNEIKDIDTNYNLYKKQFIEINETIQRCNERKISLLSEVKTLDEIKCKNLNDLNESLINNGFKNIDNFLNSILSKQKQEQLIQEVKIHEEKKKEVLTTIQTLSKKLENYDLSKINLNAKEIKEKLLNSRNEIESINANIIKSELKLHTMKINLEKIKELKLKIQNLDIEIDLIDCMAKLFRGNAFVRFVSRKQLSYITVEATNRLKVMTSGRYALVLKDNDFVIRDDYNGGILRSPKTLSGGEIFVVSLCLALSLSSNIQLKNSASLEFFFLDEGFGTLDENLIDDVVDCLEQLKFEKITVGIISHVKELKERIAYKLIVEPPDKDNHGSIVKLDV